jgi:hypothetical protein
MDVRVIYRTCPTCGTSFGQPDDPCRKRTRQRAQEEDARRRAREEQARRARDRSRRTTPPHAGSSRPGPFCGSCGGHRGPHTFHHDQGCLNRVPEEADACRAKAEQLRSNYGL